MWYYPRVLTQGFFISSWENSANIAKNWPKFWVMNILMSITANFFFKIASFVYLSLNKSTWFHAKQIWTQWITLFDRYFQTGRYKIARVRKISRGPRVPKWFSRYYPRVITPGFWGSQKVGGSKRWKCQNIGAFGMCSTDLVPYPPPLFVVVQCLPRFVMLTF